MNPVPLVSTTGIWFAYFCAQSKPGDDQLHVLDLSGPEAYGNDSLFTEVNAGVALTHRAVINVDVHADCEHEVAIERTLGVQIDKAGAMMERAQSIFIAGRGNAAYQGILEQGHVVRAFVSAPGDQVKVSGGYLSVSAQPV